jgi:hypothetical protein
MGVVHFEELKIRQQEIEVKALIALFRFSKIYSNKAEQKLRYIAFPDELVEKLEQQKIIDLAMGVK